MATRYCPLRKKELTAMENTFDSLFEKLITDYNDAISKDASIGYLLPVNSGYTVACATCYKTITQSYSEDCYHAEVYHSNIGDYQQDCGICGRVLHIGKTPAWPELFDALSPRRHIVIDDKGPRYRD